MAEVFVGREKEIEEFWGILSSGKKRIINYIGDGGIGKTTFIHKLCDELSKKEVYFTQINYKYKSEMSKIDILLTMASGFVKRYPNEFKFPYFITALLTYTKKTNQDDVEKYNKKVEAWVDSMPLIGDVLDTISSTPKFGIYGSATAIGFKVLSHLYVTGKNTLNEIKKRGYKQELKKLELLSPEEIEKNIHYYFILDIKNTLDVIHGKTIVVFMDTYEKYQEYLYNSGDENIDSWLWEGKESFISSLTNVVLVLSGRKRLGWDVKDNIKEIEIKNLNLENCRDYYIKNGISEKEIIDGLLSITNGNPLYMSLCRDRYFDLKYKGGQIELAQFEKDITSLTIRYLRGKDSVSMDIAYVLSLLDFWDDADIIEIMSRVNKYFNFSYISYLSILKESFITSDGDKRFMHDEVRRSLRSNLKELLKGTLQDEILKIIMQYYSERATKEEPDNLYVIKLQEELISNRIEAENDWIKVAYDNFQKTKEHPGNKKQCNLIEKIYNSIEGNSAISEELRDKIEGELIYQYRACGLLKKAMDFCKIKEKEGRISNRFLVQYALTSSFNENHKKASEIIEKIDIEKENDIEIKIDYYTELGNVELARGNKEGKIKNMKEAHKYKILKYGENHVLTLMDEMYILDTEYAATNDEKKLSDLNNILDKLVDRYGTESYYVIEGYSMIFCRLIDSYNFHITDDNKEECLNLLDQIEIFLKEVPEGVFVVPVVEVESKILQLLEALVEYYSIKKENSEIGDLVDKIYDISEKRFKLAKKELGVQNPNTLIFWLDYAKVLYMKGENAKALKIIETVRESEEKLEGKHRERVHLNRIMMEESIKKSLFLSLK